MKSLFLLFITVLFISACQNKKIESNETADKLAIDTLSQTPVAQLAFSPLDNYFLKNTVKLPDSINFLILSSQAEFDELFGITKTSTNQIIAPDFIINRTIAIACSPTETKTTIEIEKVEMGESTINVFAKIIKEEKESSTSTPARVFAIERREGVTGMDFYLNNQMVKSLILPVN